MWPRLLAGDIPKKNRPRCGGHFGIGPCKPGGTRQLYFALSGVSRALTHQLVRHRIASYSQQSQRYVDGSDFDYVIPPEIKKHPEAWPV